VAEHDPDAHHRSKQGPRLRDGPAIDQSRTQCVSRGTRCATREAVAPELGGRFVQIDVTDDASVENAMGRDRPTGGSVRRLDQQCRYQHGGFQRPGRARGSRYQCRRSDPCHPGGTAAAAEIGEFSRSQYVERSRLLLGSDEPQRRQFHFPSIVYGASKSAVSMLTVQYAKTFPEIKFNAVEPGFTATGLTPFSGAGQPVERGAAVIVRTFSSSPASRPSSSGFVAMPPLSRPAVAQKDVESTTRASCELILGRGFGFEPRRSFGSGSEAGDKLRLGPSAGPPLADMSGCCEKGVRKALLGNSCDSVTISLFEREVRSCSRGEHTASAPAAAR
jgi:hypothetical protein